MSNKGQQFSDIASQVVYINKFSGLNKDELERKINENKQNRFLRYITKHKGRTILIIFSIIILLLCYYFSIPINGDQDATNIYTKIGSALGFFSANIFLGLLVTILGVETYFSREEMEQLQIELEQTTQKDINKIKDTLVLESKKQNVNKIDKILSKLTNTLREFESDLNTPKIKQVIVRSKGGAATHSEIDSIHSSRRSEQEYRSTVTEDDYEALEELKNKISQLDMTKQIKILKKIEKILEDNN